MPRDPTIAIRDCLAEIGVLRDFAARMTIAGFRQDPIARRAAAYAIQIISEAVRQIPDDWLADFPTEPWGKSDASATVFVTNISVLTTPSFGRW